MTAIRWFLWSLITLLLLLSVVTFWLLNTESGLRWAVNRASDVLQVESITGDVSDLRFENLKLSVAGATVKVADGSLRWSLRSLLAKRVAVKTVTLNQVELKLAPAEPTNAPFTPWQGIDLPIGIDLENASITQFELYSPKQPLRLDKITLAASVVSNLLTVKNLSVTESQKSLLLDGEIDLSAQPSGVVKLQHALDWRFGDTNIVSDGLINGTWASFKIEQNQTSPLSARLNATVDDALTNVIKWSADITTDPINNQAVMGQVISAESGNIRVDGQFEPAHGLQGVNADIKGQLSAGNQEFSQWQIDTDMVIDSNSLKVNEIQLLQIKQGEPAQLNVSGLVRDIDSFFGQASDQSKIDLTGNWSSLTWPLDASAASDQTARLSADGEFSVIGTSSQYSVLADVTGRLYDRPLNANIDVQLVGSVIEVNSVRLASGQSLLTANGRVDQRLDLNWNLTSPDLGDLFVDGSGALLSSGQMSGTPSKPIVKLQATSQAISLLGYSAQNVNVSADASLANAEDALNIKIQANSLTQNQKKLVDDFDLDVDGRLDSHAIVIKSVLGNQATLDVKAKGGFDNNKWSGVLSVLTLNDPTLDVWSLQDDVSLKLATDAFSVSQGCLKNKLQSVFFDAQKDNNSLQAQMALSALDLDNVNRVTELYDIDVAGQLDGEFTYSKKPQKTGVIDGYIESKSPVLTWQESGDDELSDDTLVFDLIRAEIKQVDNLQGSVDIRLSNSDQAKANFSIAAPMEAANFTQAKMLAKAQMSIADLSVLPTVLLDSISLNGALRADVDLAGSLDVPEVIASANVSDARVDIPELGIELEGLTLTVDSKGTSKVDIGGQLKSGEGLLNIDGGLDFSDLKAPALNVSLIGENLQLANTQTLNVVGDVDFNVSLAKQMLDLQGGIILDKAELDFKLPETAVLVSDDVVLEGAELSQSQLTQRIKLTIDLGEKTHISAKGLDADLLGKLVVSKQPEGILRGEGEIKVNNGRYRAYGQDLKIDKGRLIFDGGSIDDPSLSLTAEKTIESTTAGVSVSGRASSPRLNLYSTPSMQDEDILSVLVFNKPVGDLGSQDGLALLRIANSLRGDGTSEVTKVTEKLQRTLGLTSLELQTNNNAPSIVAGKQLSSKLYVGYGYGLLDAAQSLILRYNLNKAWSVKADLGADSGADLRYQLER